MGLPIFLIGFMGAGKSSLGRALAEKTGYTFIDLDAAIEIYASKSIEEIFDTQGESEFRELEKTVLFQLKGRSDIVVATGGGCATRLDNLAFMKENGICIFLQVQAGVLFHRLAPEKSKRPLIAKLKDVELMEFIMETLPIREFYYKKADLIINGEEEIKVSVQSIIQKLSHQSFSGLAARIS
jgi:shikimate kinase